MFGLLRVTRKRLFRDQKGLNMVDLMIWMVIAALLTTISFQAARPYRQAAIIYQMKNDISGVVSISGANGTDTGKIQDAEVEAAVEKSQKSEGITISWGKFALYAETPPPEAPAPSAFAGNTAMELASSVTAASAPALVPGHTINTYVLVARHPEVPNLRVIYFFDDIHEYKRGVEVISITQLPPIQDMFGITPDPSDTLPSPATGTPTPTPTVTGPSPSETSSPTPAPSTTVMPSASASPSAPSTSSPTPTPTESATTSPTPAASPAATEAASLIPSPSPSATALPEDPTPEPNPLTPGDNLDPKTKKFLFCHGGMMHSNSYTGMIQGHEHHADDIMPPIPPQNFPGWNWNYRNAQTFYNNCVPVTK